MRGRKIIEEKTPDDVVSKKKGGGGAGRPSAPGAHPAGNKLRVFSGKKGLIR